MHEFSLMDSILSTVDESARNAGAVKVLQIDLIVGDLTQVVQEAMDFAFEALAQGTICEGAKLNITYVKPKSRCLDCELEFEHDALHRRCPGCGSSYTTIVAGKEMYIDKIEADVPDD